MGHSRRVIEPAVVTDHCPLVARAAEPRQRELHPRLNEVLHGRSLFDVLFELMQVVPVGHALKKLGENRVFPLHFVEHCLTDRDDVDEREEKGRDEARDLPRDGRLDDALSQPLPDRVT